MSIHHLKPLLVGMACLAFISFASGCHKKPTIAEKREQSISGLMKTPGYQITSEAVSFLHQLRVEGKMPGVSKDEQIILVFPPDTATATNYPIIRDFGGKKQNVAGPWPYHFRVIKTSATNDWELQRAWRTDANGKVVEEYSVPKS